MWVTGLLASRTGSPAPNGYTTICDVEVILASAHLPSGDQALASPSPIRTTGDPSAFLHTTV